MADSSTSNNVPTPPPVNNTKKGTKDLFSFPSDFPTYSEVENEKNHKESHVFNDTRYLATVYVSNSEGSFNISSKFISKFIWKDELFGFKNSAILELTNIGDSIVASSNILSTLGLCNSTSPTLSSDEADLSLDELSYIHVKFSKIREETDVNVDMKNTLIMHSFVISKIEHYKKEHKIILQLNGVEEHALHTVDINYKSGYAGRMRKGRRLDTFDTFPSELPADPNKFIADYSGDAIYDILKCAYSSFSSFKTTNTLVNNALYEMNDFEDSSVVYLNKQDPTSIYIANDDSNTSKSDSEILDDINQKKETEEEFKKRRERAEQHKQAEANENGYSRETEDAQKHKDTLHMWFAFRKEIRKAKSEEEYFKIDKKYPKINVSFFYNKAVETVKADYRGQYDKPTLYPKVMKQLDLGLYDIYRSIANKTAKDRREAEGNVKDEIEVAGENWTYNRKYRLPYLNRTLLPKTFPIIDSSGKRSTTPSEFYDFWDHGDSLVYVVMDKDETTSGLLNRFIRIHTSASPLKAIPLGKKAGDIRSCLDPCILKMNRPVDEKVGGKISLRPYTSYFNHVGDFIYKGDTSTVTGGYGKGFFGTISITVDDPSTDDGGFLNTTKKFISSSLECESALGIVRDAKTIDDFEFNYIAQGDRDKFLVNHNVTILAKWGSFPANKYTVKDSIEYMATQYYGFYGEKALTVKAITECIGDDTQRKPIQLTTPYPTNASCVSTGRNKIIASAIGFSDFLYFGVEGNINREAGGFFYTSHSGTLKDSTIPRRLQGLYWAVEVVHTFDFTNNTYTNLISGVKPYLEAKP